MAKKPFVKLKFNKEVKDVVKTLEITKDLVKQRNRAIRYKALYTQTKNEVKELGKVINEIALDSTKKQVDFVGAALKIGLTTQEVLTLCRIVFTTTFDAKVIVWYRTQMRDEYKKGTPNDDN